MTWTMAKIWTISRANGKKTVYNRNKLLEQIRENIQIREEIKCHYSQSIKCDYKCYNIYICVYIKRCRWFGCVKRKGYERLPKIID